MTLKQRMINSYVWPIPLELNPGHLRRIHWIALKKLRCGYCDGF